MASLLRWGIGFVVAATAGVLFGLAAGWWRSLERLVMPSVHTLQLVPGLAWIPVAILLFGIGDGATLFMIAITAFPPVAINVVNGVKRVDEMYVRAARMMGATNGMLFFRVLVPGALPHIVSGLRVGLGNGWRVLVAAEMVVGTGAGLGYAIIQSRWTLDYTGAFVCLTIICVLGLVVEQLIFVPLERRTIERWGLQRAT
jgi:ABC-type nitrate/sulfonate/bicarbonate transport system permease component